MSDNSLEGSVWSKVMSAAMSIPGIKVDRDSFLREKFSRYCATHEQMNRVVMETPLSVIDKNTIDKVAASCIMSHLTRVTGLSTLAGIPGGLAAAGSIPADIAQYYYHVLKLSQKLAYIYGFPSLTDESGKLTDDAVNYLTIFVGVSLGAVIAGEAVNELARRLAINVAERLPRQALTKTTIYPIVKKVAAWLGVKLTKASFNKGLSKVVPVLGGLVSGGLTYAAFKPGAQRLQAKFKENMALLQSAYDNPQLHAPQVVDIEHEDVTTSCPPPPPPPAP